MPVPPPVPTPPPLPAPAASATLAFCQSGLLLRSLLLLAALLLLGSALAGGDPASALLRAGAAMMAGLPALLLGLGGLCLMQRRRAGRLPGLGPTLAWGAACGALGLGLQQLLLLQPPAGLPLLGAAGSGALGFGLLWQEQRRRARAARPAAAQARLADLQSRIRPHFLFNTLNSAIALVRLDPPRAETVLEDLADLFRAALRERDGRSTLGEELDLARRYLAIEQVRHGERLQVDWQTDPACHAAVLPPLLLQPLVENAVRHGIERLPQGGTVSLSVRALPGRVELRIRNPVPQDAPPAPGGHGIALDNVRERLRLMHDVEAELRVLAEPGQHTVLLRWPLPAAARPTATDRGDLAPGPAPPPPSA